MKDLPFALEDASPGEAAERIYVFVNGPMGLNNPQRQGLDSALSDGRGPLNVLGGIPTINLGSVEIHRELMTAAARWMAALKLELVLSARIAIRLNSFSLPKKFSIR